MNEREQAALERIRREVEATDRELLSLVARRAEQVRDLWAWKRQHGLPVYDPVREKELHRQWVERARDMGLEPGPVVHFLHSLLEVTSSAAEAGGLARMYHEAPAVPEHHRHRRPGAERTGEPKSELRPAKRT